MPTQPQDTPHPLPEHPSLGHLKDQAKDLLKSGAAPSIAKAQFQIAKSYGFPSWPKLKAHVEETTIIPDLIKAITAGDLQRVRRYITRHPRLLNANLPIQDEPNSNHPGSTPLHLAIGHHHAEIVRFLVDQGADLNRKEAGRSSLHLAIEHCDSVVDYLIEHGATVDISVAANKGFHDQLRKLLRSDPSLANHSGNGSSPLEWAVWGRQIECIRILIEHGAQVETERFAGDAAIRVDSLEALGVLLDHVHSPKTLINRQYLLHTAVVVANTHPNAPIIRYLLQNGADPSGKNKNGQTPLDFARAMWQNPHDPWGKATPEEVARRLDEVIAILQGVSP